MALVISLLIAFLNGLYAYKNYKHNNLKMSMCNFTACVVLLIHNFYIYY